jgi:hypothetical protein
VLAHGSLAALLFPQEVEADYRFAGRFIALALFSNTRIWFRLSRHVIKYMLRKPVQWHDLAFYSTAKYVEVTRTEPLGWLCFTFHGEILVAHVLNTS